jgi:hypothetical protein
MHCHLNLLGCSAFVGYRLLILDRVVPFQASAHIGGPRADLPGERRTWRKGLLRSSLARDSRIRFASLKIWPRRSPG